MILKEKIAVVIAVHNRLDFTKRCLDAIRLASNIHHIQPLVVDDGSTDGTCEYLIEHFPEVKVIKGDGNLWFGGATQLGFDHILNENTANYIITLNNDVFLRPGAIDIMVSAANSCTVVGAGYFEEDTGQFSTAGFMWKGTKGLIGVSWLPDWNQTKDQKFVSVDAVSTTATLYPCALLKKISRINLKLHPHNRYDVLLSAAIRKAGASFLITHDAMADHVHGPLTRNKSCRTMTIKEFYQDSFGDPVKVSYLPGLLHSTWVSAPSLVQGALILIYRSLFWLAQALYVVSNATLKFILRPFKPSTKL
jgi:GT2 family glycosyltransferase